MDGSTLGLVAVFVSGYMLVTVPLMLVTGRLLRCRSRHLPFAEGCADAGGSPAGRRLREEMT
jgi:hypothetical protein